MKIAFYWQGFNGRYGQWRDGLWAAMQEIEAQGHDVEYLEPDTEPRYDTDIVLYWEAPCTLAGKDAEKYRFVQELNYPKALLFAGGQVRAEWLEGFDLFFVESAINEAEFGALGKPWKRAFGVNTRLFKPEAQPKVFDGFMQATYAGWKRHNLFAEALGSHGATAGRIQDHERWCYDNCVQRGVLALPELSAEATVSMINGSYTVVNTAEFWGGGQRCTLEAMACGVPPIVMEDSPKNREFVEESGYGLVARPDPVHIREMVNRVMSGDTAAQQVGIDYIQSKWTEKHYAESLLEGMREILMQRLHA